MFAQPHVGSSSWSSSSRPAHLWNLPLFSDPQRSNTCVPLLLHSDALSPAPSQLDVSRHWLGKSCLTFAKLSIMNISAPFGDNGCSKYESKVLRCTSWCFLHFWRAAVSVYITTWLSWCEALISKYKFCLTLLLLLTLRKFNIHSLFFQYQRQLLVSRHPTETWQTVCGSPGGQQQETSTSMSWIFTTRMAHRKKRGKGKTWKSGISRGLFLAESTLWLWWPTVATWPTQQMLKEEQVRPKRCGILFSHLCQDSDQFTTMQQTFFLMMKDLLL